MIGTLHRSIIIWYQQQSRLSAKSTCTDLQDYLWDIKPPGLGSGLVHSGLTYTLIRLLILISPQVLHLDTNLYISELDTAAFHSIFYMVYWCIAIKIFKLPLGVETGHLRYQQPSLVVMMDAYYHSNHIPTTPWFPCGVLHNQNGTDTRGPSQYENVL